MWILQSTKDLANCFEIYVCVTDGQGCVPFVVIIIPFLFPLFDDLDWSSPLFKSLHDRFTYA